MTDYKTTEHQPGDPASPTTAPHLRSSGETSTESAPKAKDVKREVEETWHEAQQGARQAADTLNEETAHFASEAKASAGKAAQQAKTESREFFERQKSQAAEEFSHVEAALRRASETLRDEEDHRVAEYADVLATKVAQCSDYLRRKEFSGVIADFEDVARRRPEIVLGSLFFAGLAAGRFLKASSQTSRRRQSTTFHESFEGEDRQPETPEVDMLPAAESWEPGPMTRVPR